MELSQLIKNLQVPQGTADVILDTDAYNEIDDQFAISYMLRSPERICLKGICAAPFLNEKSVSPEDGMLKSYDEIIKLLHLAGREDLSSCVFRGSRAYLTDEKTPQDSQAAEQMAKTAERYSPEHPLYIVAIGAVTNVASALLMNPDMKENTVVIWLGGHAHHWAKTDEFNMKQDIAAARIVFGCGVPFVQLPCAGVADRFTVSKPELAYWLAGKNPLADYLAENTVAAAEKYAHGKPWTRVLWDVTAAAWLLNDGNRFMDDTVKPAPVPEYDMRYAAGDGKHFMKYVTHIKRDALMYDLIKKLTE